MIPRDVLHQIVQDDDAWRDWTSEVRREPERSRRQRDAFPEVPLDLTDLERKRTR